MRRFSPLGRPGRTGARQADRRVARRHLLVPAGILVVLTLAPAAPAMADDVTCGQGGIGEGPQVIRTIDNLVVLTGRAAVTPEDCVQGDVVIFNGPAAIAGDVAGNLVVFNGTTRISATIAGNVTVLNGDVFLESGARVGGNLTTRSAPQIAPDAVVGGQTDRVQADELAEGLRVAGLFTRVAAWLAVTISALVLGVLLLAFGPRAAEATVRAARERTGASIGWGAGLFFLVPILAVVALATLVGIPLGLIVLFGLGLLYSIGYLASSYVLGRAIVKQGSRRFTAFFVGWLILRALAIVPVVGGIVWFLASLFGLGALAVAARRANRAAAEPMQPSMRSAEPPPPPAIPTGP